MVETDGTRSDSVAACVKQTPAAYGRIDILVNNAGIGGYRPVLELSEADYDRIMATDAKSTWLFSREVLPHMLTQGAGNVLILSSAPPLEGSPAECINTRSKLPQCA